MRFPHFFVDRPIFASVLWIIVLLIGGIAYLSLPVSQYPDIAPPTIQVNATYPGASAETVADTVAATLEEEINGVEGMLYITSQSTSAGMAMITVAFEQGTDLDIAQVLVQNRVSIAEARLPDQVRRLGVTTQKVSPDVLMVIHLYSPDNSRDQLYISNYMRIQMRDELQRIKGVGQIQAFGIREFSMRVWIDPNRAQAFNLTGGDIVRALQGQNLQVAGGVLDQPPSAAQGAFEVSVQTLGRLREPGQFENVIVGASADGRLIRLRDVARVELGAREYNTNARLDGKPALALLVSQQPGTNALATADRILTTVEDMSTRFPPGLAYDVIWNPTEFVAESVFEVQITIFEAILLVCLVVFIFLQSFRASLIPVVAIPISLVGTFAVMAIFGFSLNTLSLFGLVLAIGIVVDDAIVVVENVERNIAQGMSPKEAAHRTMDEVGGALVAIALVLSAVFIPAAFLTGISGAFFRQFALTIATATIISAGVSLTLSPAMAALLLKHRGERRAAASLRGLHWLFEKFNHGFERCSVWYCRNIAKLVRRSVVALLVYVGLIALTGVQFSRAPTGFVPPTDQNYVITVIQLPPGASLSRTDAVMQRAIKDGLAVEDVVHAAAFAGLDGATFTTASNAAAIFFTMTDIGDRLARGRDMNAVLNDLRALYASYLDAFILVIPPPPVQGIGNAGGFKMYVQDRAGIGLRDLEAAAFGLSGAANGLPEATSVFTLFNTRTPQLYAEIDRVKAEQLGIAVEDIFETLEVYLGSAYVNDFNAFGKTFRVTAQADEPYRKTPHDIGMLRTRNANGDMAPIGSVATFRDITGPNRVARYNLFPAAAVQGDIAPGYSTGEALDAMAGLAETSLPRGFTYEWTELALQAKLAGNTAGIAFVMAVVFVFLLLAALYESLTLPLAVILIVPMCLLSALSGVLLRGFDVNILVQIGFVVLIGLAAKNAILIVEFAKQAEDEGLNRFDAAAQAAKLRLRPIIMTSFAFILGVVPLAIASGAGYEMRQSLGTAVFFGMLGVTAFGLVFTPIFYVVCRWLALAVGGEPDRPEAYESRDPC